MGSQELPRRNKLLYASASLGGNTISWGMRLWLIFYYAPPEGEGLPTLISRPLLGALLFAAKLLEALDDPLIGHWSDRTRTRWGRRIPFVLFSTPFYALFFLLLWLPPHRDHATMANAIYLFIMLEIFFLFSTLSGGPFESLLPEIAPRAQDRMGIAAWQVYFGALGAGLGLVLSGVLKDTLGFAAMAGVLAAVGLLARYVGLGGAWRYTRRGQAPASLGLRAALAATLRNRQFLYFLPSFILFQVGLIMVVGMIPFFVDAVVGEVTLFGRLLGTGFATSLLTGVALGVTLLAIPFLYRLVGRTSKRQVFRWAMLAAGLYFPLLFFVGFIPGIPVVAQALVAVALAGAPLAGVYLFPNPIIADLTDYDELRTGMRREAVYYATQELFEKLATAVAPLLFTLVLLAGSTADNPLGIRLLGPLAGLATLAGYFLFRGYVLPDDVTPAALEKLAATGKRV